MQDEQIIAATEASYSPFWPVFILLAGLILWSGYEVVQAYSENSAFQAELKSGQPAIQAAQTAQSKLYALAQDLIETSAKDNNAAQIVKEANIQVRPNGGVADPTESAK